MIRYLDVCSGYSAFTLAAAGLPFRCVGYSEIEPFPRAILEQRYGAQPVDWDHRWSPGSNVTPLFGDFTRIEPHHVGPVDLLVGGTPCQSFSVAGKRLGLDDPRGNLTLEFLALARRLRVPWLAWENVPGFLSHDEGRTMGTFLGLLGECGYRWAYRVLDAQYVRVDGAERAVPQRRRRLFVVGHIGDGAGPAAVLFERESLRGDPAPRREAGEGIAGTLSPGAHPGGFNGQDAHTGHLIAHTLRAEGFDASEDGSGRGTPLVPISFQTRGSNLYVGDEAGTLGVNSGSASGAAPCIAFDTAQITSAENRSAPQPGGPCHPLSASAHPPAIAFDARQSDVCVYGDRAAAIDTDGWTQAVAFDLRGREGGAQFEGPHDTVNIRAASGGSSRSYVAHHWAVRRLTPTECERLQDAPDGFTAIQWRGKPAPDGPRYKVLGNSQARNCMRWIARGLADVIAAQAGERAA